MQKVDRLGWAAGFVFQSYGVRVGVRANEPEILDRIAEILPFGWKPAREAVRALHDALPMLVKSEKVILVTIDTQDASYAEATPSTHQMVEMLRRHGVNAAEQALVISDIPAEEALLNEVAVHGADMIVVGAYGHSRLRELLLGGVTRFLPNHSTVPVLMSH